MDVADTHFSTRNRLHVDYQQFMTDPAHPTPGNTRFDASALWKQSTVTREQIANCSAVEH